ncbi:MAG: hypothetical protein WBE90_07710 [Xanthobacteraceae bacterium]
MVEHSQTLLQHRDDTLPPRIVSAVELRIGTPGNLHDPALIATEQHGSHRIDGMLRPHETGIDRTIEPHDFGIMADRRKLIGVFPVQSKPAAAVPGISTARTGTRIRNSQKQFMTCPQIL